MYYIYGRVRAIPTYTSCSETNLSSAVHGPHQGPESWIPLQLATAKDPGDNETDDKEVDILNQYIFIEFSSCRFVH